MNILLFLAAFAGGSLISAAGYLAAKRALTRQDIPYTAVTLLRQVVSVIYLAVLFGIALKKDRNIYFLPAGGALGVTVPSVILTVRLLRQIKDAGTPERTEDENG